MPKFEIETPQGRFEVEAPDQETAVRAIGGETATAELAAEPSAPSYESQSLAPAAFDAATEGSQAGLMFGFDDEIGAGMMAPIHAGIDWFKGEGFSIPKAYNRLQQQLDARKATRRSEHPVASIAGEVAGGLATGAGASKAGLTLAGKSVPGLASLMPRTAAILPAAAEGAGYGALYGAGEAKPGERLSGAATGAAIGGITGGVLQGIGNAIATRSANKAAQAAAPTTDDLKAAGHALYRAADQQGVMFKDGTVKKLAANLKFTAGGLNEKLRPLTAGTVDDVDRLMTGQMTLQQVDEFRQGLNLDIGRAKGSDKEFLLRMKRTVDHFLDNVSPSEMTGGPAGVGILKEARQVWQKAKKTEVLDRILDLADVQTGQYTQSGLANTITREMRGLYKQIAKGKAAGYTKEEIALIRQMAKGGSNSSIINLFAKFAPRGVVSIVLGQGLGSMVPGAGNVAVPLLGELAGRAADRGALQAAQALRTGIATGRAPVVLPQITRRVTPAIPAVVSPSMGTAQSLLTSRAR